MKKVASSSTTPRGAPPSPKPACLLNFLSFNKIGTECFHPLSTLSARAAVNKADESSWSLSSGQEEYSTAKPSAADPPPPQIALFASSPVVRTYLQSQDQCI